jgi:hypothetical protein
MTQKIAFELMPVEFDDVAIVLQQAAQSGKYAANGWLEGKDFETEKNLASIKRHINDYRRGIKVDSDSGIHPLLHAACRLLMQYTVDSRKAKNDQLFKIAEEVEKELSGDITMCRLPNCTFCHE